MDNGYYFSFPMDGHLDRPASWEFYGVVENGWSEGDFLFCGRKCSIEDISTSSFIFDHETMNYRGYFIPGEGTIVLGETYDTFFPGEFFEGSESLFKTIEWGEYGGVMIWKDRTLTLYNYNGVTEKIFY